MNTTQEPTPVYICGTGKRNSWLEPEAIGHKHRGLTVVQPYWKIP